MIAQRIKRYSDEGGISFYILMQCHSEHSEEPKRSVSWSERVIDTSWSFLVSSAGDSCGVYRSRCSPSRRVHGAEHIHHSPFTIHPSVSLRASVEGLRLPQGFIYPPLNRPQSTFLPINPSLTYLALFSQSDPNRESGVKKSKQKIIDRLLIYLYLQPLLRF